MAKFYGEIGYVDTCETSPGVWEPKITTRRSYFGELTKNALQLQSQEQRNDSVVLSNEISIVADQFAFQNFHSMCYIEFMGVKWKIEKVEPRHPRLILTIGGIYHD